MAKAETSAQPVSKTAAEPTGTPELLLISSRQVQAVAANELQRVAIGDPEIIDVTIVSPTQMLIQAKQIGSTNLIVWDAQGERHLQVTVVDPKPEAVSKQLKELLQQINLPSVGVRLESGRVFLTGEVDTDAQLSSLEQTASAFQDTVINLVTVRSTAPPSVDTPPLVKLTVQVIDLNHSDLEKMGVKWPESIGFMEQSLVVGPGGELKSNEALIGKPGSLADRVGEAFKIGRLARLPNSSFALNILLQQGKARLLSEPKLVTASGKEASSFIGVEVPYVTTTTAGTGSGIVSATIAYRQTGVLLKMTPTVINADQEPKITIIVEAEISGIDKTVGLNLLSGTQSVLVPGFKVRKASSEVTTDSGETILIAGLLESEDSKTVSQVPGLGGIPGFGRLFRSPEIESKRRELIIAITPELVGDVAKDTDHQMALEQALAVAEVTASVDDPRLRYALKIQDRIAKALRYPQREKELNIDGTVKLRIHLFADGTLGRAIVSESSGIESLDMEALKAAESQAPYPGFPSQMSERELWLDMPVIFHS